MQGILALAQGLYYVATGAWPLVSIRTFEAVTGPKVDRWLVKTVGVLVGVIGLALLLGRRQRRPSADRTLLAAGSAGALATIDTVYAVRGRISKIYLLDLLPELVFVVTWVATAWRDRRRRDARLSLVPA